MLKLEYLPDVESRNIVKNNELWSIPQPAPIPEWMDEEKMRKLEKHTDLDTDLVFSKGALRREWAPDISKVSKKKQKEFKLQSQFVQAPLSNIGMSQCNEETCISNTAEKTLKKTAKLWNLLDEQGRCEYPEFKHLLNEAITMLKKRGQYMKKEALFRRVKKKQSEIYELRKFVMDMYAMMKTNGFRAYCAEIEHISEGCMDFAGNKIDSAPLGSFDLACPFCGSKDIRLQFRKRGKTELVQGEFIRDLEAEEKYREYQKELRSYRYDINNDIIEDEISASGDIFDDILNYTIDEYED